MKRKNKKEMEGVHDNVSAFIEKKKQLMAKVSFLNQYVSFFRKLHLSSSW